ncbi:MAG: hypothetical protein KMY54_05030 [Erysipelothrix sp.]|nr:hypothetical protein [Erysipelothrix sp.]
MKRNPWLAIFGGMIGLFFGLIAGGYVGLVLGGTFLGGFDIYKRFGIEGYELSTYVGAFFGAIAFAYLGAKFVTKRADRLKEK